jgi:AhpD family alkylhydroperoxidase
MTDNGEHLSTEQKELVAVGASVGAGCHPCVKHHIRAAVEAGVGEERLIAALTSGDRIATEATKRMVTHSRGLLGAEPTAAAASASSLDDALASFGAAITANDRTAIETQLAAAQSAGVTQAQLGQAVKTAAKVQENAARIHLREAERLVAKSAEGPAEKASPEPAGSHRDQRGSRDRWSR